MERAHWAALLTVCALSIAYAWRHRTHRPIAVYLLTLALCDALRAAGVLSGGLDRLAFLAPPVVLLGAIAATLRSWVALGGFVGLGLAGSIVSGIGPVSASLAYTVATATVLQLSITWMNW